ncbi:MAG: HEAT repeat domain-containing protein, partial [Deltaproteobacteria bacterium]|nr:HEAT repeat domain-containing protein [Deltaproteobacteria bacterium]
SEAFDSAETLAVFLGVYLAVSNLVEIFTGTVITPWLLRRYGVRTANLVHPVLTLLVFPVLWLNPVLLTAIAARAVRELVENAVAAPIRQLSYNALPFRFRGRVRALLEGVVLFAAMATAGLALIVVGRSVDLLWLCTLGGGLALLYLSASFLVRREYLRSLVTELRRGRLDLQNLDAGLGQGTLTNLAEQWEDLLIAEPEYPSSSLLKLAGNLAERGFGEVVLRASQHPHPRVRTTCIEALANFDSARLATALPKLLDDQDSDVRLAAIRAAVQLPEHLAQIDSLLRACLDDPDPRIRAHASVACGAPGEAVLKELLASDEPGEIVAALESLPVRMSHAAENRLSHPDRHVRAAALSCLASHPDRHVRAAALSCLARYADDAPIAADRLLDAMTDSDARVREAATRALPTCSDERVENALAIALDDSARAKGLARLGEPGVRAALPQLQSARIWTADAALQAVASARGVDVRPYLANAYQTCVSDAWTLCAGIDFIPAEPTLAARFLRVAFENAFLRNVTLAFQVLGELENRAVVQSVRRTLDRGSNRNRADALEVLSNLADRETSDQFALLLEAGPFREKLSVAETFFQPPRDLGEILAELGRAKDRWLRLAASPYATPSSQPEDQSQHQNEVDLMQRLLALRQVPLFTELSLDRLEAIHQLMHESQYLRGECVVREGDVGDDLFVLLEGELEIYKSHGTEDQRLLSTLTPVGYMGEIAVLDGSVRSATAIASKDSRLLRLGGVQGAHRAHSRRGNSPRLSFTPFVRRELPLMLRVTMTFLIILLTMSHTPRGLASTANSTIPSAMPGAPPLPDDLRRILAKRLSTMGAEYVPRTRNLTAEGAPLFTNRLLLESSPYLQQHAHN